MGIRTAFTRIIEAREARAVFHAQAMMRHYDDATLRQMGIDPAAIRSRNIPFTQIW